jgi:ATP-binding cassette, subfamily B, bacterial
MGRDLRLCTCTDIDRLGRYRLQWLAVTDDTVAVVPETDDEPPIIVRFTEANEFRCEAVVGSGLLQARVGECYVDLLRYSNRMADRFAKVAKKLQQRLAGEPIVVTDEDETPPPREGPLKIDRGAVLTRIYRLMLPYRRSALAMLGLLGVGIGLDLVAPQLTRILVDRVLPGSPELAAQWQQEPGRLGEHVHMLLLVVGVLAAVQVMRQLVNIVNGRLGANVGTAITMDMRNRLVDHLQKLSVGYYDKQQVGSLVGRVAYDTEALHGLIHQLTGGFLAQLLVLGGVVIVMYSMDPWLATFALLPAPLVITGSIFFWRYVYPRYYRFWDTSSKQAGMLSGMLAGIRVVKAFAQEDHEQRRFALTSDSLRQARLSVDRGVVSFNPVMGLLFQLGGWIVWFVGGRNVLQGHLTLGELMAFFGYLWMFYGPLATLTQLTNWLTQFATQMHRIFEILDTPSQIAEPEKPVELPRVEGRITFEHVSFGYDRHGQVLRDVNFDIEPGCMIGIVGRSGSGKSTIVNLICRFYDVGDGAVKIDGIDVRHLASAMLRHQIGVVLQEPFLFRGSLYENLVYGRRSATPQQVIASAKSGNCHDFILRTAHGYDTWVGERGAGLSGGERQRVSIARVLLADPRILVLDEATSSVDAESEAAIQAALAEVVKGRTTIAIAHRLSTLRHSDRILVVDAGHIVESGSHTELMGNGGIYARLVKMQGVAAAPTVDELAHQADDAPTSEPANGGPVPYRVRWLTPEDARIHLGGRGLLHVTVVNERIYSGVFALRCLPVHYPSQFISLRYLNAEKREVEVGLIETLADWPQETQELVRLSLLKRYFVHTISAIESITVMHGGFLDFRVDTDLGPMQFLMRHQGDRAQDYGKHGKLLLDIDENRYLIPDTQALPVRDRRLFTRYIYW